MKYHLKSTQLYPRSAQSLIYTTFPTDLLIFFPSNIKCCRWNQCFVHGVQQKVCSLCTSSLVWCTGICSTHHVWISSVVHNVACAIALHSICHHGNHNVLRSVSVIVALFSSLMRSPERSQSKIRSIWRWVSVGENFHNAKSVGLCFQLLSTLDHCSIHARCHSGRSFQ